MVDDSLLNIEARRLTPDPVCTYIETLTASTEHGEMRDEIDRVIADGQLAALAELLNGAKASDVQYAARRFSQAHPVEESPVEHAERLAERPETAVRQIACQLLSTAYDTDSARSVELLGRLVNDEDWTVRDAAATVSGRLLRKDFPFVLQRLHKWREDSSACVRRAVVVAAARAAHPRRLEWAEPLLKLIEPLLSDRDPLVRRNLGPSALATSLLQHYPIMTFEYLVKWSTSSDSQVLWNVAMAFSGSAAASIVKKAIIVLRKLSLDERRYVWRAAASATWKLGRRRPEIVRPELMRWLEDDRRIDVAREALKHL
jgi:hypothetical protein